MDNYKRHVNFFSFGRNLMLPFMKLKFNYSYEPLGPIEGPVFFLCNHNTDYDPILTGIAAGRHMYYVATEKVTRMGLLSVLLKHFIDPILHYKGKQGIVTTKSILKHIKKGHSVAMFPEGNRSFNGLTCPIPVGTAKLAKACGATLVTYRLRGGYFSTPRWGKGVRKGSIKGEIAGVYSPAMLSKMTDDEVYSAIKDDLFVDAYEDQNQNKIAYKNDNWAESLESTICYCPRCKRIGKLTSSGKVIACECGFTATIDEYGYLHSKNKDSFTITEWDELQKEFISDLAKTPSDEYFSDNVSIEVVSRDHSVVNKVDAKLSVGQNGIKFADREVPFDTIEGIAINQKNLLMVHIKGEENHFECVGDERFNALKYLYLVRQFTESSNGVL